MGSRDIDTAGGKKPGLIVPGIVVLATANPVGLIVVGGMKLMSEKKKGSETLEGAAERTADEIAKELKKLFRERGWI